MDTDRSESAAYLSPTAPEWAQYYKRAKATRRLGRNQHKRIERESAQRRRRANIMILVSTAALVAVVAVCYVVLGSTGLDPEGRAAPSLVRTA
jgi:hypothetical protein